MISNDNFNDTPNTGDGHASANSYAALMPLPLLQSVRVASPCNAVWDNMQAVEGERVHYCMGCQKNVYNLSAMTQAEAEGLLRRHEGRLCVRYYQRHDGTVLTGDCPIGAQMVRMGLIRRSAMAAGLFAMLFGAMAAMNTAQRPAQTTDALAVVRPTLPPVAPMPVIQGDVAPTPEPQWTTGKMRLPDPRPMMGIVSRQPDPIEKPAPPAPDTENLLDTARENTTPPSEPDTTDAALLHPR